MRVMKKRTRIAESSKRVGTYWYNPTPIYQKLYPGQFRDTVMDYYEKKKRKDFFGLLPPSDCDIQHDNRMPPVCTGDATFHLKDHCEYCPPQTKIHPQLYSLRASPARTLENDTLSLQLLAETNPFRADFSVPLAIWELLDLAALFKFIGSTFAGFAAGAYLNFRFGWLQFVQDLKTLTNIVDTVLSRVREFESLSRKGGLRRNIRLYGKSLSEETQVVIHSSLGCYINGINRGRYKVTYRGSVRWCPTKDFRPYLAKLDKTRLALSSVFDLRGELSPATFWNMIPFSWLVDYFVGIGDLLEASEGIGLVAPYDVCIMRYYRGSESVQPTTNMPKVYVNKGKFTTSLYSRDVWVPPSVPPSKLQFLTATKVTTLAAIATQFLSHLR